MHMVWVRVLSEFLVPKMYNESQVKSRRAHRKSDLLRLQLGISLQFYGSELEVKVKLSFSTFPH
jgi:hypothetical protein